MKTIIIIMSLVILSGNTFAQQYEFNFSKVETHGYNYEEPTLIVINEPLNTITFTLSKKIVLVMEDALIIYSGTEKGVTTVIYTCVTYGTLGKGVGRKAAKGLVTVEFNSIGIQFIHLEVGSSFNFKFSGIVGR